jgi:hypothetical protein
MNVGLWNRLDDDHALPVKGDLISSLEVYVAVFKLVRKNPRRRLHDPAASPRRVLSAE